MERYKNLSGESGVLGFEIGEDFIRVLFNRDIYIYNYITPGRQRVEDMKFLAVRGIGLNAYINQYVKKEYASKSRM